MENNVWQHKITIIRNAAHDKIGIVLEPNAIIKPFTMMIKLKSTSITLPTMFTVLKNHFLTNYAFIFKLTFQIFDDICIVSIQSLIVNWWVSAVGGSCFGTEEDHWTEWKYKSSDQSLIFNLINKLLLNNI